MPSGGSFFWKEKTCNLGNVWYNHETLERGDVSAPEGRESRLTHNGLSSHGFFSKKQHLAAN